MKIALVHELLTMKGGAETVLRVLADMYPDAPIYTLLYDEKKLGDWFPKHRVRTSSVQRRAFHPWLQAVSYKLQARLFNHHLYLRRFPRAVEAWDFSEFDLVISTSSAFAHGIITNGAPKHLSYIHAPARYLWDRTHDVQSQAGKGLFGWMKRAYLSRTFHKLREWDSEAAQRADVLLAASKSVQRRIELYWRRESEVLYPPIDDVWFNEAASCKPQAGTYLIVSSLVPYKRIDIAIDACNRLNLPLTIAGTGPAYASLKRMAGPTITFAGYVPRDELRGLYQSHRAVIFPGDEDFGLVPLEAMACGTPVVAYRAGGALETIVENETGIFFDQPTAESLCDTLKRMDAMTFDPDACRKQAGKFSRAKFAEGMERAVAQIESASSHKL